jgi:hypothetical protein
LARSCALYEYGMRKKPKPRNVGLQPPSNHARITERTLQSHYRADL